MNIRSAIAVILLAMSIPVDVLAYTAYAYFSPNGGATQEIVRDINEAKKEVLLQAYSFTSIPIEDALIQAYRRGINVIVVLDKSNERDRHSVAGHLLSEGIPVLIDWKPAIAHSKIIIIDRSTLLIGSFNFTRAAEEKNTENLLVLRDDPKLMDSYLANFMTRKSQSQPMKANLLN